LPRNPYCSNKGMHCGCRLPIVTLQPQWVRFGARGDSKTVVTLENISGVSIGLIARTLAVLLLYFVHFSKPTNSTTIIIHTDSKSNHVTCIPGSAPSPASSSLPGSQNTLPSTPVPNQRSPTKVPPSPMKMTKTTMRGHEVVTEDGE
ncbi:hypothetical protein EI555_009030, partial [Monodon monoceros]